MGERVKLTEAQVALLTKAAESGDGTWRPYGGGEWRSAYVLHKAGLLVIAGTYTVRITDAGRAALSQSQSDK